MSEMRMVLAQARAKNLLDELSPHQSAEEQKRIIQNKGCSYLPPFGYSGPAFDLETLLEDPGFRLPGKSRADTERIIAEAAQGAKAGLTAFAKEQHAQFMRRMFNVTIALLTILGGTVVLTHLPQIDGYIEFLLGH